MERIFTILSNRPARIEFFSKIRKLGGTLTAPIRPEEFAADQAQIKIVDH
jgi:hypothetical protein